MLHEHIQHVFDFEKTVGRRVSQNLGHMAQVWMQLINLSFLLICRNQEINRSVLANFLSAAIKLFLKNVLLSLESNITFGCHGFGLSGKADNLAE